MGHQRPPGEERCEVWWAGPESARPSHLALLDAVELGRRARLRRPIDQSRFTVAAALLRLVVGRYTGDDPATVVVDRSCAGCGQMHGKPRVPGTGLGVSVSHSGERVAVACGRGVELGVDVEEVSSQADGDALVGHVRTASEAAHLDAIGPAGRSRALLTYWTRK